MTRFSSGRLPRLPFALALALALPIAALAAGCRKTSKASGAVSESDYASAPAAGTPAAPAAATGTVRLVEVELGNSVRPDKTVQSATETFAPNDTIFAAVKTDGTGTATIEAKWTYKDGQVVKTDSRTIDPTGPAVTDFSIEKPGGWPTGDYKVEISVSGTPTGVSKGFKVI